jgi:RNA polymerase sigma-70 factor (ECF subfamily)
MSISKDPLLEHLDAFVGFVRRRTGDPELSAEVVQEALSKALAKQDDLRDPDRLLPWFWRILRNTLSDALAARERNSALADDVAVMPEEDQREACRCIHDALRLLPERQRQAIERIDLAGQEPVSVARALGMSEGNLKVIRHRARAALHDHLMAICRTCAKHGCIDCHCHEGKHGS